MSFILKYGDWKRLFEQAKEQSLSEMVVTANSQDLEEVKSHPVYSQVMDWFKRPGPTKGRMDMDKEKAVKSMQYWNGDLTAKTGNISSQVESALELLTDSKNVESLKKGLQKASGTSTSLTYETDLIVSIASQLKEEFQKLHKSGKIIAGPSENTGANYMLFVDASQNRENYLGLIPFSLSDDQKFYKGKDLSSTQSKQMDKWYKKVKAEGIDTFLKILTDKKYHKSKATKLDDSTKIKLLDNIQSRANRNKKNIEDALSLYFTPIGVKDIPTSTKTITSGEPIVSTQKSSFAFPYKKGNEEMAKTYFKDDLATFSDGMAGKMVEAINEVVKTLKSQGAEITKFTYTIIASTSNVPSQYGGGGKLTGQWSTENNKTLVNDRKTVLEAEIKKAVSDNGLAAVTTAVAPMLIPNNTLEGTADWAKVKDKYKLKVDPNGTKRRVDSTGKDTTAEYEAIFGPARHSGATFEIEYQTSTVTPTEDETETFEKTTVGDWKVYIRWEKIKKDIEWNIPTIGIRVGGGPPSGGSSVKDLCAAYGG